MSDFSFVPLRPFFYAALAKRWKVQFRQLFAYFNNNVDSKRHIIIRTAILYIYIHMISRDNIKCFPMAVHFNRPEHLPKNLRCDFFHWRFLNNSGQMYL